MQFHIALEKIDQNHTNTICWKCDGFVMDFSEKPSLFIKTIWRFVKSYGFKNQQKTINKPIFINIQLFISVNFAWNELYWKLYSLKIKIALRISEEILVQLIAPLGFKRNRLWH